MHRQILYLTLSTMVMATGCIEEYDLGINENHNIIVIDAMITDQDAYHYVYLSRSGEYGPNGEKQTPVEAEISLYDDEGHEWKYEKDLEWDYYVLMDSTLTAGHMYTLKVKADGREFSATQYMCPPPKVDGITFAKHTTKDSNLYFPTLHFTDSFPNEVNYYLFDNFYQRRMTLYSYKHIQYISDEGMKDKIDGIELGRTIGDPEHESYNGLWYGVDFHYQLYTLSKDNYEYFKALESQITNDGGTYKPNPVNPPTNFKGKDVQGQFIAASEVYIEGTVDYTNIVR